MFREAPNRLFLYVLANVAFAILVGAAYVVSDLPDPRLLYLILFFALCSTCVIDIDGWNGRYALLALFSFVYFISFGGIDFRDLIIGSDLPVLPASPFASPLLSKAELVILVGGVMLVLGYRITVLLLSASRLKRSPRDWSKSTILISGLILWAVGTIATYRWNVYIITDTTIAAGRKGLATVSPGTTMAYLLAQMFQPFGMLLLAYAWRLSRSTYLLVLVVAAVVLQIFIGFVIDVKGMAMLGIILVIMTSMLVDGRLPKVWLLVGVAFVALLYPYFTAYRAAIHGAGISRTAVIAHFGEVLQKTIAAKDQVNSGRERAPTFLERANVKSSVQVVVEKTGNGVAFQDGHTLSPILQAFIPKIILSDKEWIATGRLFNNQFHIDENEDIYISPSHLGELYWNFGWPGVVLGMGIIGSICGWVGARFNLAEFRTVTGILVTAITIKQLIVIFESSIADCYVVWLRSLAGIAILHLAFARVPAVSRFFRPANSAPATLSADQPHGERLFPNLLS